MEPPRDSADARERGVALLIVLVVLFIVAVLMVDITLTATTARRAAENASAEFLMDAAVEGRFRVALEQLRYDMGENKHDCPDDRWARPEYTDFEAKPPEEDAAAAEESDDEARLLGDSEQVTVTVRVEDEERKFNLNLLMHPDAKQREAARERFAVLIDRFREDSPLDISRTKADELRDRVVEYLERAAPGQGERGKLPVPKTGAWRLLTPDELRYVEGFEDTAHGMGPEGILYEARDPQEAKQHMADPENTEAPESYPGLLRYVTLWSGGAWLSKDDPSKPAAEVWAKMILVNVNTAEKPVLETLFYKNPQDYAFADRIIEYRDAAKDGSAEEDATPAADEPLATHQYFEKLEDLKKVDGFDETVQSRNSISATTVTVASETFSLDFLAKLDRAAKQIRFVVRRHSAGFQTVLREVRADPRFDEEDEEAAAAEEDVAAGESDE